MNEVHSISTTEELAPQLELLEVLVTPGTPEEAAQGEVQISLVQDTDEAEAV